LEIDNIYQEVSLKKDRKQEHLSVCVLVGQVSYKK